MQIGNCIADLYKFVLLQPYHGNFHRGDNRQPNSWQDNNGREIDCLLADGEQVVPIEIGAGKTLSMSYLDNLKHWRPLAGLPEHQGHVVFGGDQSLLTSTGQIISWRDLVRIQG